MGTRRLPQPAPSFLAQPGAVQLGELGMDLAAPAQLLGYLAGGRGQFGVAFQPAAAKLLDLPRVRARRHGRPAGVPGCGSLSESELLGAVAAQPAGELLVGVSRLDLRHVKLQAALHGPTTA